MLLTRDALLSTLFSETDRAKRTRSPLALIHCGIDDWASWRSQLGEPAYEELLFEVSRRIARLLRCYDLIGRVGDDELIVVLSGCSSQNAVTMAERLKIDVFGSPLTSAGRVVRLNACFGVTASGGRSPLIVLQEADRALRFARERGPGAIECFRNDAEPDLASFLIPVLADKSLHW